MLPFILAICVISLALFWVVRCGPHNGLRAFVVELLSAGRSVLSWIGRVATSNRAIYCGIALYVMWAMQWEPLWALFPFIIGALIWRAYKKHSPTGPRDRLPVSPVGVSDLEQDIPTLPDLSATSQERTSTKTSNQIEDPLVMTPSVFYKEPTNWNQYKEPTWRRRGIDVAAALQASVLSPVIPAADTHIEIQAAEVSAATDESAEEQQGSFIYN